MVWSLGSTEEVVHLPSEWQRNTECISEEDRGTSKHSTSTVGRRLPPRVRQKDKGVRGAHDKRRTREVREELMGDASRERHDVQLRQDTMSIVRRQDESRLHGVHQPYEQQMTYPVTLHNAAETLNRHRVDHRVSKFIKNVKQQKNSQSARGAQDGSNESGTNLAQSGGQTRKCFVCGDAGHVAPECTHKMRPKEQWVKPEKYRNYSALQAGGTSNDNDSSTGSTQSGAGSHANDNGSRAMVQWQSVGTHASSGVNNSQWSFVQTGVTLQQGDHDDESSLIQINEQEGMMEGSESFLESLGRGIHLDSGSTFPLETG